MIGIEGPNIGGGKTELALALKKRIKKSKVFLEQPKKVRLKEFYYDVEHNIKPSHEAMMVQLAYMDLRYAALLDGMGYEWTTRGESIFDRTIWGDYGFAWNCWKSGFLTDNDHQIYLNHRATMERQLLPPHAIIYIDVPPEFCIERLKQRILTETGRKCEETGVTVPYLEDLKVAYDTVVWPWFQERGVPILTYKWHNGTWDSFPDIDIVLRDLQEVLPSYSEIVFEASSTAC